MDDLDRALPRFSEIFVFLDRELASICRPTTFGEGFQ